VSTTSVVLATVALGMHWALDVVAGVALAAGSVFLARLLVERADGSDPAELTERRESLSDD